MAMTSSKTDIDRQHIMDEIEQLRRDLATRRIFGRPAPRSIVNAYHELLERQYTRLDRLTAD